MSKVICVKKEKLYALDVAERTRAFPLNKGSYVIEKPILFMTIVACSNSCCRRRRRNSKQAGKQAV